MFAIYRTWLVHRTFLLYISTFLTKPHRRRKESPVSVAPSLAVQCGKLTVRKAGGDETVVGQVTEADDYEGDLD